MAYSLPCPHPEWSGQATGAWAGMAGDEQPSRVLGSGRAASRVRPLQLATSLGTCGKDRVACLVASGAEGLGDRPHTAANLQGWPRSPDTSTRPHLSGARGSAQ